MIIARYKPPEGTCATQSRAAGQMSLDQMHSARFAT
jgi:hypothetical protein